MQLRLVNRSGYDTEDLRRFLEAGLRARARKLSGILTVVVVSSPIRSRGCADVVPLEERRKPRTMDLAIAPPSYYTSEEGFMRRLSRLFDHEIRHVLGDHHEDMSERDLYSTGRASPWSRGLRVRYRGRAPRQSGIVRISRKENVVTGMPRRRTRTARDEAFPSSAGPWLNVYFETPSAAARFARGVREVVGYRAVADEKNPRMIVTNLERWQFSRLMDKLRTSRRSAPLRVDTRA